MKALKKILPVSIAAAVVATAGITTAHAEVGASVGVASTYLWRGYDLGSGTPAVSGDLNYSIAGLYTGIWGSSGDTAAGTEYDLYAGYGMDFDGGFNFDISVWNYNYPSGSRDVYTDGETNPGDLTDVILTLGFGPVSFSYYEPVGDGSGGDYNYYTLSGSFGAFSLTAGMHDTGDDTFTHLNVAYAYNDNLSFTLSQFVDGDEDAIAAFGATDNSDDLKFVVSYSIPLM